jgi:hypothetical protein
MRQAISDSSVRSRILVCVASYGISNDRHLLRLVQEYRSMPFDIDIVILSNVEKKVAPNVEVIVGLPNRNPWSLPFVHKRVFAERLEKYDVFIYSEDDILITQRNVRAFLEISNDLRDDEIAGFLRLEKGPNDIISYPEVHGHFHWDPTSVRVRGKYTLAHFTNEHAACYVLTRDHLRRAIQSGGFLVEPHEWKYDLLCTAATDPYTQCGFVKLIPISNLDDFTVWHLSNKYISRLGVDEAELRMQIYALMRIATSESDAIAPLKTETALRRQLYSKNYYEPISEVVTSAIPREARSVLSIGCGWGATESALVERAIRVVAVPLDSIICGNAVSKGVEMVFGDFGKARTVLNSERFDCLLYLNVLHLFRDPVQALSLFADLGSDGSVIIIHAANMVSYGNIWPGIRAAERMRDWGNYDRTGVNVTSKRAICNWCTSSGLSIVKTIQILPHGIETARRVMPGFVECFLASEFVTVAKKGPR